MTTEVQTPLALIVVAAAAVWLLWRALRKSGGAGCGRAGDSCAALSREVKTLKRKLKRPR